MYSGGSWYMPLPRGASIGGMEESEVGVESDFQGSTVTEFGGSTPAGQSAGQSVDSAGHSAGRRQAMLRMRLEERTGREVSRTRREVNFTVPRIAGTSFPEAASLP